MIGRFFLYFHTIKHLRLSQIFARLYRFFRPTTISHYPVNNIETDVRAQLLCAPIFRESEVAQESFTFLNHTVSGKPKDIWNVKDVPKLWLYNLHYFDCLRVEGGENDDRFHRGLLRSWIECNPLDKTIAWEPYPTSLRIVNIIKWCLIRKIDDLRLMKSLAEQIHHLERNLEYHILGNHLLANVKALIFAGVFFKGVDADRWLKKGLLMLTKELHVQILDDGGHFELSPMYHSIVLEDILDLKNLFLSSKQKVDPKIINLDNVSRKIEKMLSWMRVMTHPDGEISFFNDSCFGIGPPINELFSYAERLNHTPDRVKANKIHHLKDSGYVRVETELICAILDVASLGPTHLPAHAHADTLSFELSVNGRRIIVNGGTSIYEQGALRNSQRSTKAHSTVEVNDISSSEVWSSFRVARRARILNLEIEEGESAIEIIASHDGYRRGKVNVTHHRKFVFSEKSLIVEDEIEGDFESAIANFHLHPNVVVVPAAGHWQLNTATGDGLILETKANAYLADEFWYPQFGVKLKSSCIKLPIRQDYPKSRMLFKFQ